MSDPLSKLSEVNALVEANRDNIITFLRELCAIPSHDSLIKDVGERAAAEMQKLGFRKTWFDRMGNIVGEIGDGPKKIVFDSHIDTVGIGDLGEWDWDPFEGKIEDGIFYARGACDEKGSTPGMIYGLAFAHQLGLLDGYTAYYFGNMEEWNDGIAPQGFVEVEGIRPDFVVIGEPTLMRIYRGQKGRVEMKVVAKGKSAHAANNYLGDNPIYKLTPIIDAISKLEPTFKNDPFLGEGRITVTDMHVNTPSLNAVPNEATIYIDRRITFGETPPDVLQQVKDVIGQRNDITAEILIYNDPSYTGFVLESDKIYPAWALPEDHVLTRASVAVAQAVMGKDADVIGKGKWDFSTNGIYWNGKAGIPSIGFGPGNELHAHTVLDQVPLEDVVKSTAFYALLPAMIKSLE